jgi:hypothetical protein
LPGHDSGSKWSKSGILAGSGDGCAVTSEGGSRFPNRDRDGVIRGLRPTKANEDAACINSWQAEAPANSAGNDGRLINGAQRLPLSW